MSSFAEVDDLGQPVSIINAVDGMDVEENYQGSNILREIPEDISPQDILERWMWRNGQWSVRPERPSSFHRWDGASEEWVFDAQGAKEEAIRAIEGVAEQARNRYITSGSGQAMEYESAAREAERYLAGDPGAYPMLQADVDAGIAEDMDQAAQLILGMRGQWETIGSEVRKIRLLHKRLLGAAGTYEEVTQIRQQALAQLNAL